MPRRYDTVSFLSDYGLVDEFAAVVRSVIRSLAPHAVVIDVTHDVPPHDVRAGSLTLARSIQYLAPGVILAVVDPGVGTARRAVAVEVAGGEAVLVGPDNGLLAPAVSMVGGAGRVVELTNTVHHLPAVGATFAGRDVFAPVAAALCNGVALAELGPSIDPLSLLPGIVAVPREEQGRLLAEVLWVDRFGNAQLNVSPDDVASFGERVAVRWRDEVRTARVAATYGLLKPGELGLVIDSYGMLSLALDRLSAAEQLRLKPGDGVSLAAPE